jgi:hypothetical protein
VHVGVGGDVLGDAEVDDLHHEVLVGVEGEHHVVGGDVAMQKSAAVDVIEAGEHLHRHFRRQREREAPVCRLPLPHGRAVDELGDHVARAVREDREVVDDSEVRMVDLRGELRLAQEARAVRLVGHERRLHHFDAAKRAEMDVAGLVDLAHAARAEKTDDLVLAVEHRAGCEAGRDRRHGDNFSAGIDGPLMRPR